MNSKQIRGLSVINIADDTQVGTVDQVFLDLTAKQVVGFSITNGVGPFGGARDNAPTVAASGVHSLGPDALTFDDVLRPRMPPESARHMARLRPWTMWWVAG